MTPIEVQDKLTLVLPLRDGGHHGTSDLARAVALLLPSLRKFLNRSDLETLIVITPPEDRDAVGAQIAPFVEALRVELWTDDDVVRRVAGMKRGWTKQQILKLGIAGRVRTAHYLVLDSDNLLVRPTSFADLCPEGRPRITRTSVAIHPHWYRASRRVLRLKTQHPLLGEVMGVTPQILHTQVCRDLLKELEQLHRGLPWECVLAKKRGWTEYSLYWLYLTHTRDPALLYHLQGDGLQRACLWSHADFHENFIEALLEGPGPPFSVLQSRIRSLELPALQRALRGLTE